jgi:hypothetical protein
MSLEPPRLRIVTMPASGSAPCTGGYTCSCDPCVLERLAPRPRGALADHQPWLPRPFQIAA